MIPNYCRIFSYIEDAKRDFDQKYEKRDRKPHYTIVSVCGVIVYRVFFILLLNNISLYLRYNLLLYKSFDIIS